MEGHEGQSRDRSAASVRTLEIVVSLLLLAGSAIVLTDSVRLGVGWLEGEGPAPGYFPFYIALTLAAASIMNLVRAAVASDVHHRSSFASVRAVSRVLAVFIPAIGYVAAIHWLGIYVSSALFIAVFMVTIGRETLLRAAVTGLVVPVFFFLMFEKWFLVPLPKGPLEALLGY